MSGRSGRVTQNEPGRGRGAVAVPVARTDALRPVCRPGRPSDRVARPLRHQCRPGATLREGKTRRGPPWRPIARSTVIRWRRDGRFCRSYRRDGRKRSAQMLHRALAAGNCRPQRHRGPSRGSGASGRRSAGAPAVGRRVGARPRRLRGRAGSRQPVISAKTSTANAIPATAASSTPIGSHRGRVTSRPRRRAAMPA